MFAVNSRRKKGASACSGKGGCLTCQKKIGIFRRFRGHTFCSEDHERAYTAQLEELAVQRLREACLTLGPATAREAGSNTAKFPAPAPVEPKQPARALVVRHNIAEIPAW